MGNLCCENDEYVQGGNTMPKQKTKEPVIDIQKKDTVKPKIVRKKIQHDSLIAASEIEEEPPKIIKQKTKVLDKKMYKALTDSQIEYNEQIRAKYNQIVANGELWSDPDFPPEMASLTKKEDEEGRFSRYKWERASQLSANPQIFSDGISPSDVAQGEIGDCYFLAVCSSMAEEPTRVMDRFITKEPNSAGVYLMYLYVNGVETPVMVDDWFPTVYGKPAFGHSDSGELWVSLLEKAWAKLHGSYAICEGGMPTMASTHLCGVPSYDTKHSDILDDIDGFWSTLMQSEKHNFAMMSATKGQGENVDESGIVAGHAYSLISVYECTLDNGSSVRLCKLRNPWGKGEWKGDWSDESDLWTDKLRQKMDVKEEDDGIFYMAVEDYANIFESTSFCVELNLKKFHHSLASVDLQDKERCAYNFEIENDIDCSQDCFSISVQQNGDRLSHYRDDSEKFTASHFNIILLQGSKFIKGYCCQYDRFQTSLLMHEGTLEAGQYQVLILPAFNESADLSADYRTLTVDFYCTQEIDLQETDADILSDFKSAVIEVAKNSEEKDFYLQQQAQIGQNLYRVSTLKALNCWIGFMYYRNDSDLTVMHGMNVGQFRGIELFRKDITKNENGEPEINFTLTPGSEQLFLLNRTQGNCSYSVGLSMQFSM